MMEGKHLVRTLAEPNLTTLSGVKASFLAGGQVPIRVADEKGNATITYRDFGVRLVFTPVVLDGDRIQIQLTPEVSGIGGYTAGDPVFNTRNLDATVELRDGQSFRRRAAARRDLAQSGAIALAGRCAGAGGAFPLVELQEARHTELVVIVTPRLVRPAPPGQALATPLDATQPASDLEFFALGKLEVSNKMLSGFKKTGQGVAGPYGHMIDLGEGK